MKKIALVFTLLIGVVALNASFTSTEVGKLESKKAGDVKYNVKKINGLYSMKIADYMTETTELQQDASLQYNNLFQEKYLTVLDEKKEDVEAFQADNGLADDSKSALTNYAEIRLQYLKENGVEVISQKKLKNSVINGHNAISTIIDAKVDGIDENITYYFTYVEGTDHFYMVSAWTLMSLKRSYTNEVKVMVESFKEL